MDDTNIPERLRERALAGLSPRQQADPVDVAMGQPLGYSQEEQAPRALLALPEGWEEAVDAWVRAGCPKGDPVIMGRSLAALHRLAQLPREQRPDALSAWRRQIDERKTDYQGPEKGSRV